MFAYCLNNPVCFIDSDGQEPKLQLRKGELSAMMLLGAATSAAILTNPGMGEVFSQELDRSLSYAKQEIYEYAQRVKQELLDVCKKTPHVHHIVPVGNFSQRSEVTQRQIREMHDILSRAGINRYVDPINLILVSPWTHASLHTDSYIAHVHHYLASTDGSKDQLYLVLFALRIEIAAKDVFASGY